MDDTAPKHVIVVGGGIIGASLAWYLAALGAHVTVIAPPDGLGGTATPNSFAWINANRGNARHYYELRRRSMAHWRVLSDEASGVPGLAKLVRWTGTIQWNEAPADLERFVKEHSSWGYRAARIDNRDILQKRETHLRASALAASGWAVATPDEGSVEPALAAKLLLKQAAAVHGSVSVLAATVTRLVVSDGRVAGVVVSSTQDKESAEETLTADHVAVAAGLGSVTLCASVGIDLPVYGRPGLLAHSKPITHIRLLNGIVLSAGPHVRQTVDGRLVVGADFAGGVGGGGGGGLTDSDEQRQAGEALLAKAKDLFYPEDAKLIEFDFATVGERPQPRDGLPIIAANAVPGLAVAVMHSGVTLAPIVGDLLAREIVLGEVDEALEAFDLKRFGNVR
ncbi:MAG: hypothetical protein STHCBS139747_005983 [Sporothrix thermara]